MEDKEFLKECTGVNIRDEINRLTAKQIGRIVISVIIAVVVTGFLFRVVL